VKIAAMSSVSHELSATPPFIAPRQLVRIGRRACDGRGGDGIRAGPGVPEFGYIARGISDRSIIHGEGLFHH
jgi:hypothetical protein